MRRQDSGPDAISTREKILICATDLFAEKGYTETTIRELATAVGMKGASIYNHFPSKNAILEAILDDYTEHNSGAFYDHTELYKLRENPTADGIMACLQLTFPKGQEEYYLKVLYVVLQEQHRNPVVRRYISENIRSSERHIGIIISILQDLCIIRRDIDPDFWMKIGSSVFYAFSSRRMLGIGDNVSEFTGMSMEGLLRHMFDLMLKLYGVEGGERERPSGP